MKPTTSSSANKNTQHAKIFGKCQLGKEEVHRHQMPDPDFAGRRFSEEKKNTPPSDDPAGPAGGLFHDGLWWAGLSRAGHLCLSGGDGGAAGDGDFVGDLKDQDISRSSIKKNPHFPHWWVKFLNFWSFKAASIARGKVWAPIVLWMCQQKEGRLPTDSAGFQRSTSHDHPEKTA